MAHGFSAVKEMYLDKYAELFSAAGLNALVFDNRNFGASDGEPRREIDPIAAGPRLPPCHHLREQPAGGRPDARSASGARATPAATCSWSPPSTSASAPSSPRSRWSAGYENIRSLVRSDFIGGFREMFDADREARGRGEAPAMVPVVDKDPLAPVGAADAGLLPVVHRDPRAAGAVVAQRGDAADGRDARASTSRAPTCARIAPTPLLMMVAQQDVLTPTELAHRRLRDAPVSRRGW